MSVRIVNIAFDADEQPSEITLTLSKDAALITKHAGMVSLAQVSNALRREQLEDSMARPRKVYPIGARVRHGGEQYPTAQHMGTAVITGHDWHGDHLEYLIHRDKPRFEGGSLDSTWAFYHTRLADNQPDEIQAVLDGLPVPGPNEQA